MNALRLTRQRGQVMDINRMYISEKEVSLLTGRALSTLRNDRFHRKGLPYVKISRSVRYSYDDVITFMENRKIKTDPI
jgi:hypothetical protein